MDGKQLSDDLHSFCPSFDGLHSTLLIRTSLTCTLLSPISATSLGHPEHRGCCVTPLLCGLNWSSQLRPPCAVQCSRAPTQRLALHLSGAAQSTSSTSVRSAASEFRAHAILLGNSNPLSHLRFFSLRAFVESKLSITGGGSVLLG